MKGQPSVLHRPDELRETTTITGSISADPNPIDYQNGNGTTISWDTSDPLGAQVHVVLPDEEKKLVSSGPAGSVHLPWVSQVYPCRFELYSKSEPAHCLDRVDVTSDNDPLGPELRQLVYRMNTKRVDVEQLAHFIAETAPRCLNTSRYPDFFQLWQKAGLHLTPVHFYQPIPDTSELSAELWEQASELPGVQMNEAGQLELLCGVFRKFKDEYNQLPITADSPEEFGLDNGKFDGIDAIAAYCMVRHFKPRTVVEVGSGYSSLIIAKASVKNGNAPLVCIEPFPLDFLKKGFPGLRSLMQKKVEQVDCGFFSQLESGDILFLDSSHTVRTGGDVNYLFLEVLPRLQPGVLVHVHDVFFPFEYPRGWVLDECRFWSEQYLLRAFLAFNSAFEVLLCNSYLAAYHPEELKKTFSQSPPRNGGSFWMRRKIDQAASSTPVKQVEKTPTFS